MANKTEKAAPAPRHPLIKTVSEVLAMDEAQQADFRRRGGTTIEDAALNPAPAVEAAPAE